MRKPQKAGGAKIHQAFDSAGDTRWTCWQKADGESTRGWGDSPNEAYKNWLYLTLVAEGAPPLRALRMVKDTDYA